MYEVCLALDIRFPVMRMSRSKLELEHGITFGRLGVHTEIIAKRQMVDPELTPDMREVNVVLPWIPSPKEVATWNSLFSTILISGGLNRFNHRLSRVIHIPASENIQYRLCHKARHCGASRMFEHCSNPMPGKHSR